MISSLRGIVSDKLPDSLILDVHGVGYEVRVTPRLWQAARAETEIVIYTHFHVREDNQVLFGFTDLQERDLFRTLLTVSGVGPKTAMAVMSAVTPDELIRAVQTEDAAALKAPGVGPKIVKRLIAELKPAFDRLPTTSIGIASISFATSSEAVQALQQLGYSEEEIRLAMKEIEQQDLSVEQTVKSVLRLLAQ